MAGAPTPTPNTPDTDEEAPSGYQRLKLFLFGKPRDLQDRTLFQHLALVPFLAWVGLGADGLSSSSYGPEEAFRTLGEHTYLAIGLAALTALTVFVIAAAYRGIIEEFPHGGGGYLVATKLMGPRWGVVSGSALLVDYILTIAVSITSSGDALFSFLPITWQPWKLSFEVIAILGLTILNIRGVKESVVMLLPVFILFLITHVAAIVGGILVRVPELPTMVSSVGHGFQSGLTTLGAGGMFMLFIHAYSMGGGTYTGIEAVSNGLPIMREPQALTGRRTMVYMAGSLAFTAAGLLLCYLLWNVEHVPGKTMNSVFLEKLVGGFRFGWAFVIATLFSEGALLIVGAQAGFIDGPRVLSNMAIDSWAPHSFAALSERLTTRNGIVLMGMASLAALLYTKGDIRSLVVMYSINVFLTFSVSMFAMSRMWFRRRRQHNQWKRHFGVFLLGFLLCITILLITCIEKFGEGGWLTLVATGFFLVLFFIIRGHYRKVSQKVAELYDQLGSIPCAVDAHGIEIDPKKPTAVVMVGSYGGLGIHTTLNIFRVFPGYFKNLVFISVGVIDSGGFKGEGAIEALREQTEATLKKYMSLACGLGVPATYRFAIGTDVVDEAEKLCRQIAKNFQGATFFAGKIIFERDKWYGRLLHNETAFLVQKRLQWAGIPMVVIPAKL